MSRSIGPETTLLVLNELFIVNSRHEKLLEAQIMSELSMVAKNWVGKHFERDLNSARLTLCTGEYCRLIRTESSGDGTSLVMVTSFVNHITFITMCITTIN